MLLALADRVGDLAPDARRDARRRLYPAAQGPRRDVEQDAEIVPPWIAEKRDADALDQIVGLVDHGARLSARAASLAALRARLASAASSLATASGVSGAAFSGKTGLASGLGLCLI